jgi:predicted glycosyltransferase
MYEANEAYSRQEARERLGLGQQERVILVASGGGGDADAVACSLEIAHHVARHVGDDTTIVVARGPVSLDHRAARLQVRTIHVAPIQPLLAAFDGAFAPAGYNMAHELAKARVPAALFARPRPYDDQAGRATRFEAAGLATKLDVVDETSVASALDWMSTVRSSACIEAGGADRAADAIVDLVTGATPKWQG